MLRELFTTYRYSFGCLFWGSVAFFASLATGILYKPEFFSRGASIVVLFGAAAEYGLLEVQNQKINERIRGLGGLSGPVLQDLNIPSPFAALRIGAHICVVIGTFIWGFGDLMLQ